MHDLTNDTNMLNWVKDVLAGDVQPETSDLVKVLERASDLYYNGVEEESFLTDDQFNALERMLGSIDPKHVYFSQVGSDVRGGKVPLPFPMGSLDQVYEGDTEKWIKEQKLADKYIVLSDKQDGTSGLIRYGTKGELTIGYSRGNGIEGADVTRHLRRIKHVPQKISRSLDVRVEFILEPELFKQAQEIARQAGKRVPANARNYVAGKMNSSEADQWFYDNVKVIVTSVVNPKMGKVEQFRTCEAEGFRVTYYRIEYGRTLNDTMLTAYLNERRELSTTEIDGIVLDIDDPEIRASLRRKSSSLNPTYSKKFKVGSEDNVAIVPVTKVLWRPSKTGYMKPRVEIQPVQLMGVTITYATGFNAKFIRDGKIGPGAMVKITRSGDVIPYILDVVTPAAEAALPDEEEFGPMLWTENEVDMYLLDASNSDAVTLYRIIDIFRQLDVPHLRQGNIEKLITGGLDTAVKIIRASKAELQKYAGESAGEKIYDGLRAKLNPVPLHVLAGASGLLGRGIGKRKLKKLVEVYGKLEGLTVKDIVAVEGFETKTASVIVDNYDSFKAFLQEIDGFYTIEGPKEKVVGGDLHGLVVVFTGVRDKDLEAKIEAKGGTIGSGVNAKTTHLVCKDPNANSSKLTKARELLASDNIIDLAKARELWG